MLRRLRHLLEYSAFLLCRAVILLLPPRAARALGRAIGRLAHAVLRRHRRIARSNLALAFPELSGDERERIARACFQHLGLAAVETIITLSFDQEELCRRIELECWHHLQEAEEQARERGTGVFLLSAHLGLWEVAAYPPGIYGGPLHVVGRPLDNPFLDRRLVRLRSRFGNELISKHGAVRSILRAISRGARVGILIDQRARPREGIWVPFFDQPAYSTPVLARLALRTGAPVVPVFGYPLPAGRYQCIVRPAIWPCEADGLGAREAMAHLTRRYLEACEKEIRAHPGMWLWMHERWKGPVARGASSSAERG